MDVAYWCDLCDAKSESNEKLRAHIEAHFDGKKVISFLSEP